MILRLFLHNEWLFLFNMLIVPQIRRKMRLFSHCVCLLTIYPPWSNRRCQSDVFNSSQKMALRAPCKVICPQALWILMKQNAFIAIFWQLLKTIDCWRLLINFLYLWCECHSQIEFISVFALFYDLSRWALEKFACVKGQKTKHYLMRFEPNWKIILQNSGKWISIPEGM